MGEEVFSLGPLITIDQQNGQREIDALGPFIESKSGEGFSALGVRPLFYMLQDDKEDSLEFDFLYPLSTYDRRGDDRRFQFLIYLLSYDSELTQSGFRERDFTLFPFVFSKRAEEKDKSYFALFPIYGKMKDKFFKDEVNFVLFPLYLQTKSGETKNTSIIWPFFGYYTGGGQEGFRIWPLFGYRKKNDVLDEKFALWPIYLSRKQTVYGEPGKSFAIFPLYSSFESPDRERQTYLWPLFNRLVDREKGIERYDVPWPFINFTRGTETENRVFPFFAREVDEEDEQGFLLWPIYRYKNITLADHIRKRKSFFLFLYVDEKEIPITEGGRSGRSIDMWPLFSYERDGEGSRHFHFLSILEPFLSNNTGIERNYADFWRLFKWKEDTDGTTAYSFLWNTVRKESDEKKTHFHIKPIIPIFSYDDSDELKKWNVLGGLLGYKSNPAKKELKLFYIPVTIGSEDSTDGGLVQSE